LHGIIESGIDISGIETGIDIIETGIDIIETGSDVTAYVTSAAAYLSLETFPPTVQLARRMRLGNGAG
jgi:hypothetical protein